MTKLPKFGIKKIGELDTIPKNEFPVDSSAVTNYLTRYTYDNFNRLTCSSTKGSNIVYQYNAEDYRIQKSVNGEVIRYLYEADIRYNADSYCNYNYISYFICLIFHKKEVAYYGKSNLLDYRCYGFWKIDGS
ncbi:hypothetical protein [Lachnoclostridium sp.]|uniref:hypothetical protein n=1 Tax=Lachnoclostridium sp. TaxID=2028282 RepID=UPI0026C44EEE|nr:hypothetical protein [Lachnoclostridium sp.]